MTKVCQGPAYQRGQTANMAQVDQDDGSQWFDFEEETTNIEDEFEDKGNVLGVNSVYIEDGNTQQVFTPVSRKRRARPDIITMNAMCITIGSEYELARYDEVWGGQAEVQMEDIFDAQMFNHADAVTEPRLCKRQKKNGWTI